MMPWIGQRWPALPGWLRQQAARLRRRTKPGIYRLRGPAGPITITQAEQLWQNNLRTSTDLWERVGASYDQGIRDVATVGPIDPNPQVGANLLRNWLSVQGRREAQAPETSWLGQHVPDFVVLAAIVGLAVPYLLVLLTGLSQALDARRPTSTQVVAPRGIPAQHVIGPTEVALATMPIEVDAMGVVDAVVGHVAIGLIAPGTVIRSSQILALCQSPTPTGSPGEVALLSLPVKSAVLAGIERGACVSILLSPRSGGAADPTGHTVGGARVVDLSRAGDNGAIVIAVALSPDDREALARLLGTSNVFVLHQ